MSVLLASDERAGTLILNVLPPSEFSIIAAAYICTLKFEFQVTFAIELLTILNRCLYE